MAFADLVANLNLNIANFSSKLSQASRQMRGFASNMQQSYGVAAEALNKHNLHLKDTVRIVHGIVIAQSFYQAAGAITDATRSLWDFNVALDYMKVTYSALFGDTKVASDFMAVLQEHSVETIFDYQNLADASKKLLAYGIEYENLMFIMEGLTNLGAMSGDSAALDRIALALGQIYTKGKLSAEEMRQLANAYIPITEILQTKFGLTGEDLKRVGDLNLPAADVINAIVDYANENFGSVGDAAMFTITGLQNKIVDTVKVLGAAMLGPLTTTYKSFLEYIANGLEVIRTEYAEGGFGGVFEHLVPDPRAQQTIRQFIANVKNLFMSLASVGVVVGQVFGNFASVIATAFNIVTPVVVSFVNVLSGLLNAFLNTREGAMLLRIALVAAAGAFVVLKIQAAAALVITAVTKAVITLSKALMILATLVARHPILSLIAGLTIAMVGVSTASDGANKSISGLFDTLSGVGSGASSGDILKEVKQDLVDSSGAADQFNNRLDGAANAADNLAEAIGGAGSAADKAAKKTGGLLSFDEVYKLPEQKDPTEGSGSGSGTGTGGLLDALEDLTAGFGGLSDALIPDIPDFNDFITDFTDGLFGGLQDSIVEKLKSVGIGALIGGGLGAIIGGLLGGPSGALLGAKIGAFAGGFAGLLWEKLGGAVSNTVVGAFSGIAATIGRAFTSPFGTTLATTVSLALRNGGLKAVFGVIASAIKNTGIKEIAKGGIIGAAIGLVVDSLAHMLWGALDERFENADEDTAKVGQTIGSVLGAVIGGILGGPAGAIIGSAIGTFAGGFVGLFWEPIKKYFDPKNNVLSAFFVQTGKDIASWATTSIDSLSGWWDDTKSGFTTWAEDTGSGFSTWWEDTKGGFSDWYDETVKTFSDWDSINGDTLGTWWSETKCGFSTWKSDTTGKISSWSTETGGKFSGWFSSTFNGFTTWKRDTENKVSEWKRSLLSIIGGWVIEALAKIGEWTIGALQKFEKWKTDVGTVLTGFALAAKKSVEDGMRNMLTAITTKLGEVKTEWDKKWNAIKTGFGTWWSGMKTSMDTWLEEKIWRPISNFFNLTNFWNKLGTMLDAIKRRIGTWWDGVTDVFSDNEIDVNVGTTGSSGGSSSNTSYSRARLAEHATGGIFNREHIARFAEGNKAEAIIPLENASAMQPFVDAVSDGIVGSLAPIVAQINSSNSNSLQPLYVGTLIADERGLKQLYKKFEVMQLQESARRGTSYA